MKRRFPFGAVLLAVPVAVWTGMALWFQLPQGLNWAGAVMAAAGFVAVLLMALKGRKAAWLLLIFLIAVVTVWWLSIRPLHDRDWALGLDRGVVAEVQGSKVHLSNVRDFEWETYDTGKEHWIEKTVDLDQLESVDFIRTVWSSELIAHTMISFGFSDGQHVVFSAEIQRESDEKFSELGGFFKMFELVLVGATEEDIVRVRTHVRNEDVSIYRLTMTDEQKRALFLSYIDLGNSLASKPRFYQTITSNCTTVIWRLARTVHPGIPMDWRILLSGYTQDYLYDLGVIANDRMLEDIKSDAHITERARALPDDVDYSSAIRQGL